MGYTQWCVSRWNTVSNGVSTPFPTSPAFLFLRRLKSLLFWTSSAKLIKMKINDLLHMLDFTYWSIQKCWECNFSACKLKWLMERGWRSSRASTEYWRHHNPVEKVQPRCVVETSRAIKVWHVSVREQCSVSSNAFFLESWWRKEPWVVQPGPEFCKKNKIRLRKEWQHCAISLSKPRLC